MVFFRAGDYSVSATVLTMIYGNEILSNVGSPRVATTEFKAHFPKEKGGGRQSTGRQDCYYTNNRSRPEQHKPRPWRRGNAASRSVQMQTRACESEQPPEESNETSRLHHRAKDLLTRLGHREAFD